jgi:MFS family permease
METVGRRKMIFLSYIMMIVATTGLSMISLVASSNYYFYGALFCRFCQGIATAVYLNAVYSLIIIVFPDEQEKYLGKIEMMVGVGVLMGPFLSGLLYAYLNFFGTFLCLANILAIAMFLLFFKLPKQLNPSHDSESDQHLINRESGEV